VTSNINIGVEAIFSQYDGAGQLVTEAGVGNASPLRQFTISADTSGTFNTGVALFNSDSATATLDAHLLDGTGVRRATRSITLAARNHTALFVTELFPNVFFSRGSVAFIQTSGGGSISAVTLRVNSSPLVLTTQPIINGATMGIASVAGCYSGSIPGGNLLVCLLQTGNRVSVRVSQEVPGSVIRASAGTTTVSGTNLSATVTSMDGTSTTSTLTGSAVSGTTFSGNFTAPGVSANVTLNFIPIPPIPPVIPPIPVTLRGSAWLPDFMLRRQITVQVTLSGTSSEPRFSGTLTFETGIGTFMAPVSGRINITDATLEFSPVQVQTPRGPTTVTGLWYIAPDYTVFGNYQTSGGITSLGSVLLKP
jgi:hypothetical protein